MCFKPQFNLDSATRNSQDRMANDQKNILYGGPEPPNFTEGTHSLGELCLKRFAERANTVVLVDGKTQGELTAYQLRDAGIRVADCLARLNIKSNDVIGICADNQFEFAYVLFGTIFAGATLSPMNVTYTERELHHAVNLSKPKIIFAAPNTLSRVVKVAQQNSFIEKVICFNEANFKYPANVLDFNSFVRDSKVTTNVDTFQCRPQNIEEAVMFILYSSGTTGQPKGVELTQKNVMMAIAQYYNRDRSMEESIIPNSIVLCIIPWFHTFGCHVLLSSVINKSKCVYLPKFEDRAFLGCIQKYKVNTTYVVPPLMVFLAKNAIVDEYDLSSLKMVFCGAAPLSKELEDLVRERLNIPLIRQGYGMTEGTVGFTTQTDHNHKSGSVGMLNSGIWGRIVDPETGEVLGPYKRGELQFKGKTMMKGYIGDVIATQNTIDSNGWLHTGDIGYVDNEGEYFIVDRLKELIKYKAFQVPPAEIEGILLQHPGISDAGVVGLPDERAGELPLAFVVRQDKSITEKDIIDFVAGLVSPAKQLHGGVRFVNEIPKNPSGKILRRELRDLLSKTQSKL